jgi:plastocyanin
MRPTLLLAAAALFLIGPAAAQPGTAQLVPAPVKVINLHSYAYSPTPIRLRAGAPVTLMFVNRSGKGHDFTAREFFRSARILAGRVPNGEIDLRGGQSASVTLVPAAGRYKVHCGHPFHSLLGMRSVILVQ